MKRNCHVTHFWDCKPLVLGNTTRSQHKLYYWLVNAMRVYHLGVRPNFQRQTQQVIEGALPRNNTAEEVQTELFSSLQWETRTLTSHKLQFMDKVQSFQK